jgi:phosphohistidine phosphatase
MQAITNDADRPLSEVGMRQSVGLATTFKRLDLHLDQVFTSPLKRASQTAGELCRSLGVPDLRPSECDALAPGGSSRKLAKFLRKQSGNHIVLVGHEPDLGIHTAYLIGSKRARIEFAKGGAACIVCDQPPRKGTGVLLWLLTPNWLNS